VQPCYAGLGYREGDFPESQKAARETLALPVHSAMSREDLEYVVELMGEFYGNTGAGGGRP
jgi:dTDP-4-amino-4,6-dideoxygalactose transaminase